ncbi:MAG: glycosyl hydrolase family 18 protein [Chloroflexota bacterium]
MTARKVKLSPALLLIMGAVLVLSACVVYTAGAAPLRASGAAAVRWGFYVTYNANSLQSLQANARNLNYVSPWFFNLNANGQVTGNDQPNVSQIIKSAGAKNLPMLKNSSAENDVFSALIGDDAKVASIVDAIDALITANGYDGITIDFEAINPADKTRLTIFMSRVYDRLHAKGKLVTAVVAPKTKDITTGWAAAYDYPALGKVVDYVLVMAYDYAWANGDPGPIAPMNKLRDTATYTLSKIPAQQVIWGVGVYGYDWAEGLDGKSLGKAESRTWAEANTIAQQPTSQRGYDTTAHAPWARYTRDGQLREMWYENKQSFDAKMELVTGRGMAGFALWRLGQEDPAIWNTISTMPTPLPATGTPKYFDPGTTTTPYVPPTQTATATPPPTATATPAPKPAACFVIAPFKTTPDKIYFTETGHSLGGTFLKYWQQNGGLPVYGFPLTEEFMEKSPTDGKQYRVQYFERNRFELHPENAAPNNVQLGLLGVQAVGQRLFPQAFDLIPGPDTLYFPQVGHSLNGAFFKYWQSKGGVRQFGYPISEPVLEKNSIDGKTYTVQYLERARFELHPEYAGSNAEVLLGLLGLNISPCK